MHVCVGFLTKEREFLFADFIDAEFVSEWFAATSLMLIADQTWERDGVTVSTRDLTPVATFDPAIDRLFCAHAGERCVPDRLAKDRVASALSRLARDRR